MKMTLRALSALLGYPSGELKDNIGEVREAIAAEAALPAGAARRLEPLLRRFETDELLELQAAYSELFDRSRALSLHLFEHVHGDSRERGQAMIDLGQQYVDRGFVMERAELPDFLPMFLEFLSCLPAGEAREWLGQPAHVLAVLEERLAERNSPYSAVFHALLALARAKPDAERMDELRRREPDDGKSPDEDWQEAPVDFTAPLHDAGPSRLSTRLRAARRAVAGVVKR